MAWLIEQFCETAGIKPVALNSPTGIELVCRTNGTQTWLFALNHTSADVKIPLNQPGYELLSDTNVGEYLQLAPMGVSVIQLSDPDHGNKK